MKTRQFNSSFHEDFHDSSYSVDEIIAAIAERFPGTRITAEDWYAERRKQEETVIAELRKHGSPMPTADHILNNLDRTARDAGLTRGVEIPLDDGNVLQGRVSRKLVLLLSNVPIEPIVAERLREILRSLGILNESGVSLAHPIWEARPRKAGSYFNMAQREEHEQLYWAGYGRIHPYLHLEGRLRPPRKVRSEDDKQVLQDGITGLERSIAMRQSDHRNWSTYWLIGKAYEASGYFERSYHSFRVAFGMYPRHADVAREFTASCLRTKRIAEGVQAARMARDQAPTNPGMVANLALALFSTEELDEALVVGHAALGLSPDNTAAKSLVAKIEHAIRAKAQTGGGHV